MPNIGRPSRGCQECKTRKVKCDEAIPACLRCVRNKRPCSGYPSETDMNFRNSIARKSGRTLAPSSCMRSSSDLAQLSISAPVPTDRHSQAICMFLHDYVIDARESQMSFGHLQTLPDMLIKTGESPALSQAVSAVALTSLAHRSCLEDLVPQARQAYGSALRSVYATFRDNPDLSSAAISSDRTLITILCLDFYEIISGERPKGMIWSYHISILEHLLCARKTQQYQSLPSKGLTYTAHSYVLMRNLAQHRQLKKEAMLSTEEPQELPVIQMRELIYGISNIAMKADPIIHQERLRIKSLGSLLSLIQAGLSLNEKLQAWEDQAHGVYTYQTIEVAKLWPAGSPLVSKGPTIAHIYNSISVGSLWNSYRIIRIYLLRCLISGASRLAREAGHAAEAAAHRESTVPMRHQIQRLADGICASVPFMLGEVDQEGFPRNARHIKAVGGLFLLWPLGSLLPLKSLPHEQVAWVQEHLTHIHATFGIRMATTIVRIVKPEAM